MDPIIFELPFRVWMGIVLGLLLLLQFLSGMKLIKINFRYHTLYLPISIAIIGLIHLAIGAMIYLG